MNGALVKQNGNIFNNFSFKISLVYETKLVAADSLGDKNCEAAAACGPEDDGACAVRSEAKMRGSGNIGGTGKWE